MDLLQQSAQAWKEITEYRYLFTYGYKKQLYPINLTFSLEDYPHLAGFQYMKDISLPNYSSAKIADRILEGKIDPIPIIDNIELLLVLIIRIILSTYKFFPSSYAFFIIST